MKISAAVSPAAWQLRCLTCQRTRSLLDAGFIRLAELSIGKRTLVLDTWRKKDAAAAKAWLENTNVIGADMRSVLLRTP